MNARTIAGCILTALLAVSGPAVAQNPTADEERAQRDAERQLRDAERQLREAERAMQRAAREMAEHSAAKARRLYDKQRVAVFDDNARLGIVLRSDRDLKADAVGAVVQALTPGGPAEEAGLQAGDVITRFNGEALGLPGGVKVEDGPGPTDRLMERASTLEDGDQVTLEVKRGDAIKTFTVTARKLYGSRVKVFTIPEIEIPDIDVQVDVEPFVVGDASPGKELKWFGFTTGLRGLEMVALNQDLGEYFGASEGILVVKVPDESPYQLRPGDVILKIGDRTPSSPSQAVRILRSYGPGESVAIDVMRKHSRTTLTAVVPEPKQGLKYFYGAPEAAPVAVPAPPAPPAPPVPPATGSRSRV